MKQTPIAWFDRFGKEIKSHDFTQAQVDHTLFFKHSQDGKITIFVVCVDDIILIGDNIDEMESLKGILAKEFEIKEQTRSFGLTKETHPRPLEGNWDVRV